MGVFSSFKLSTISSTKCLQLSDTWGGGGFIGKCSRQSGPARPDDWRLATDLKHPFYLLMSVKLIKSGQRTTHKRRERLRCSSGKKVRSSLQPCEKSPPRCSRKHTALQQPPNTLPSNNPL